MSNTPILGITCGDINGVGTEILVKSVHTILQFDVIVIFFGSEKLFKLYDNIINSSKTKYQPISKVADAVKDKINILNCLDNDVVINPGKVDNKVGVAAYQSLSCATDFAIKKQIDILITMPLSKHTIRQPFFGHTEYFKQKFNIQENIMFLITDRLKLALLTNHDPINLVSSKITKKNIIQKLDVLSQSLKADFLISNPKIAVLGLNPHVGDNKLIGKEDEEIIVPSLNQKNQ